MVCPKCNLTLVEGGAFCSHCGEKLEVQKEQVVYCSACGHAVENGNKFCGKCGTAVGTGVKSDANTNSTTNKSKSGKIGGSYSITNESKSGKIGGSYYISVIAAIISLIIRIVNQETYYSWSNLLDNRKVVGIDSDLKPFYTIIPIVAAIIVSLMIVTDKKSLSQNKTKAFIINAIFIGLAILFIWFDIPYSIIDF